MSIRLFFVFGNTINQTSVCLLFFNFEYYFSGLNEKEKLFYLCEDVKCLNILRPKESSSSLVLCINSAAESGCMGDKMNLPLVDCRFRFLELNHWG